MARASTKGAGIGTQLLLVLLGALLGVMALLLLQHRRLVSDDPLAGRAELPMADGRFEIGARILSEPKPSKIIYLNREGATLRGGPDDASLNISSVVAGSPDNRGTTPGFASSSARWNAIVKCIRQKFASFDVRIVDQRPLDEDYVMVMMGGRPADLGLRARDGHKHSHALGLAPFNSESVPRAVVFVFTRAMGENVRQSCEVASMEIAHAYGLDHARHCKDLMTYLRPCGPRQFLDRDIACGEQEDRPCANGAATQNSFQQLLRTLGPAVAAQQ